MQCEKPVMLCVQGVKSDVMHVMDESQLMVRGKLCINEDGARIQYEESDEEFGEVSTEIVLRDGTVNINRDGGYMSNLVLKKGCECKSVFMTPFGRFEINAFSTDVEYEIGEDEGNINLSYQLSMQGETMGLNHIRIKYWNA